MKLAQIYLADLLNGEGLRDCYFFCGCELSCAGCFNKEVQDPNYGSHIWGEEDYITLIENAKKPYISGITILGGDGFSPWNRAEVLDLCRRFKQDLPEKTIWVYTGYTWETIIEAKDERTECLRYIDVLCDGPFIEALKSPSKPWVGSSNQRVINVLESLIENKVVLWK